MTEFWLIFKDPVDGEKRVPVDKPRFSVGRHSENDLCIADSRLSREHLLIACQDGLFEVSDRGSSNGTELNGEKLTAARPLKAGDKLCLGGVDIEIEFLSTENESEADNARPAEEPPPVIPGPVAAARAAPVDDAGFPKIFFIIAPVFALLILTIVVIVLYFSGGTSRQPDNTPFVYSGDPEDPPRNRKEKNVNSASGTNSGVSNDLPPASPLPGNSSGTTPTTNLTDTGKTEQNAASFLRRAAQNDSKAFITGQQAKIVETQIKSLAGSSALAGNLNSAKRKNAAQIKTIAASKNLKPQLLAIAAVAKLGGSKGDVLQVAQSMAEVLGKLGTQIGSELGDDCLLMLSAYDQGATGDFMKMRNMLQDLATKSPESSRAIRTVWFLKQNGKISDEQFNFALRFLAIGTISQNPKDYGVNAEALAL